MTRKVKVRNIFSPNEIARYDLLLKNNNLQKERGKMKNVREQVHFTPVVRGRRYLIRSAPNYDLPLSIYF